ncbi:MAG TPA: DinB family protein [Terriglobia bacterium]|nr:DinB family protein [Terriglobia bacterium]
MQHLANHSTYHRGQITTMLRQLGVTPVSTDLIAYYRQH